MMKTKQKTYRYRIKIIIKDNNIRHILRCIGMKDKTSRRYTFFAQYKNKQNRDTISRQFSQSCLLCVSALVIIAFEILRAAQKAHYYHFLIIWHFGIVYSTLLTHKSKIFFGTTAFKVFVCFKVAFYIFNNGSSGGGFCFSCIFLCLLSQASNPLIHGSILLVCAGFPRLSPLIHHFHMRRGRNETFGWLLQAVQG